MYNWRDRSGRNAELAWDRREKQRKLNEQKRINGRSSPKQVAQNTLHINKGETP